VTVTTLEFYDLIHLLEERPGWRAEMRRVLFTQDVLDLPRIVQELATAQQRTEEALARLAKRQERTEEALTRLAERQERTEKALARLTERQERTEKALVRLAERQERTEEALARLTERVDRIAANQERMQEALTRLTKRMDRVAASLDRIAANQEHIWRDVGKLKGIACEERYRSRANAFFGRVLTRGHNATQQVADMLYAAYKEGHISEREWGDALNADLFWGGKVRETETEVVLVLEASWLVDKGDVERASRQAEVLRQTGLKAVPVAAGEKWTDEAETLARREQVLTATNGSVDIARWLEVLQAHSKTGRQK